jgi:hypothetical protein
MSELWSQTSYWPPEPLQVGIDLEIQIQVEIDRGCSRRHWSAGSVIPPTSCNAPGRAPRASTWTGGSLAS